MLQWPSPVMGHRQVQAHVRNFLLLEGAAETAPDAEGISLLLDHLQPLDVLVENKNVKNVTPLAGSAGKEEENGNKGQEQQTPGEIHSEAHCSSTATLTFILHTSETSCLVSTNCGVDIRAVNRPSQSFTGWL